MFNPFNMKREKINSDVFLWQSKENVKEVKETIKLLIKEDEEIFCNEDVIWEALEVCDLKKKDFDKKDWDELMTWLYDTYEYEFWW